MEAQSTQEGQKSARLTLHPIMLSEAISMETGKERFQKVALFWTLAKDGRDASSGINWSQDPK